MSDTPGRVKGAVVRPMLVWLARTRGDAALDAVAEGLSPESSRLVVRSAPTLGLNATSWYDERLASELARGVLQIASRAMSRDEALRQIGRETVDASLNRISRTLVAWFASPQASAMAAPLMWSLYHDRGTVSARVEGASMFAICRDWVAHDEAWCSLVGACATRVLEINECVAPALAAHTCSGGRGPCAMTLTWRSRTTDLTARAAP